jgi:sortase A
MRFLAILLLAVGVALIVIGVLPLISAYPEIPLIEIPTEFAVRGTSTPIIRSVPSPEKTTPARNLETQAPTSAVITEDFPGFNSAPRAARIATLLPEGPQGAPRGNFVVGVPVRLAIPSIRLDVPVLPATARKVLLAGDVFDQWQAPKDAAGWHTDTALLGEPGNTVLNGHNNEFGEVFRQLEFVNVGDSILVYSADNVYIFTVTNKMILPEAGEPAKQRVENAGWIGQSADVRLTLVTCWPYESNTHRLIIVASPVK